MTHFGIICPASTGHLNPMATLGYELKQRNHRVSVIGIEDARSRVEAAGLEFQAIGASDFPQSYTKGWAVRAYLGYQTKGILGVIQSLSYILGLRFAKKRSQRRILK